MRKGSKAPWLITALCLIRMCYADQATAGDFKYTVGIRALEVYDDNLFLVDESPDVKADEDSEETDATESEDQSSDDTDESTTAQINEPKLEDSITTLSPYMNLVYETERSVAALNARLDMLKYARYSELDDIDQFYDGKFRYEVSPYTNVSLSASYKLDSGAERDFEVTSTETDTDDSASDSSSSDASSTGDVLTDFLFGTTRRQRQAYGIEMKHALSELSTVSVSYDYEQEDFVSSSLDDLLTQMEEEEAAQAAAEAEASGETDTTASEESDTSDEEELTASEERQQAREAANSKMHNVSLSLSREVGWLPDAYVYNTLQYMHYEAEGTNQDTFTSVWGHGFQLTETLNFSLDAGVRYSHENFDMTQIRLLAEDPYYDEETVEMAQDEWGPVAHARLKYIGEWTTANLQVGYDIQPSSGRGTLTERTSAKLDVTRRFNEAFRIRGFAAWYKDYRDSVTSLEPVSDEEALAFHESIAVLKDRLDEDPEELYGVDEQKINLGIQFIYDVNQYLSFSTEYRYTLDKDDWEGTDASRNRVLLRTDLKYPFL